MGQAVGRLPWSHSGTAEEVRRLALVCGFDRLARSLIRQFRPTFHQIPGRCSLQLSSSKPRQTRGCEQRRLAICQGLRFVANPRGYDFCPNETGGAIMNRDHVNTPTGLEVTTKNRAKIISRELVLLDECCVLNTHYAYSRCLTTNIGVP